MKHDWILSAIKKPVEASMFVYSLGLLVLATHVVLTTETGQGSVFYYFDYPLQLLFGMSLIILAIPGIIVPFARNRVKWLKHATFGIFLAFFFLFLLRVVIYGWIPWIWIYPLMISLSSGIKRLFVEVNRQ